MNLFSSSIETTTTKSRVCKYKLFPEPILRENNRAVFAVNTDWPKNWQDAKNVKSDIFDFFFFCCLTVETSNEAELYQKFKMYQYNT
jgi:hypothetical protein